VRIGTTPGGSDALSPMALADGRRLLPQSGNAQQGLTALFAAPLSDQTYYVSVQAVDSAFAGSSFSTSAASVSVLDPRSATSTTMARWIKEVEHGAQELLADQSAEH